MVYSHNLTLHLRASDYDGLLLDIMMPEVDGLEVLRTARAEGFTFFAISLTPAG